MKKNSFYLFAMMMAVVLCVGFASCSSDDDEGGSGNTNSFVGTWMWLSDETHYSNGTMDDYDINDQHYYQFKTNGIVVLYTYYDNKLYIENGKYSYDEKTKTLTFSWSGDGDYENEKREIISCSDVEMKWKSNKDGSSYVVSTYMKVKDSVLDDLK